MTFEEEFKSCTKTKVAKCGCIEISCIKGLWSVTANSNQAAMREAAHYFRQYRDDGEYSEIIGGMSVIEKLMQAH